MHKKDLWERHQMAFFFFFWEMRLWLIFIFFLNFCIICKFSLVNILFTFLTRFNF